MRKIAITLVLTYLAACAAPVTGQASARHYNQAIDDAAVTADLDRKGDLRYCVKNWEVARSMRNTVLQEVLNKQNELRSDSVLLEIGSSGFPRYDYIYVAHGKLRSSFSAIEKDISGTALERILRDMSTQELSNLKGHAHATADDASCYFLSIKKGNSIKTIAVYGKLNSTSGDSLIKELLAAGK